MSKKLFLKAFFVLLLGALILTPVLTTAASSTPTKSWYFEKFDVDIQIQENSDLLVKETQTFNFTGNYRFVTRSILKRRLDKITDVKVLEKDGSALKDATYSVTEDGSYTVARVDFDLTNTKRTFVFEYKVLGGIGYFDNYDELYWNTVSSDRDVVIKNSTVTVNLPTEVPKEEMKQTVYTEAKTSSYDIIDQKTFQWKATELPANSNLTIVCGFPKGYVFEPFTKSKDFRLIVSLLSFFLVIAVFIFMLFLWFKKGRDKGLRKTIVAQYEPPDGLTPAEMGFLMEEKFSTNFIAATLVNLAVKGYFKIIETEKKGLFGKNKEYSFEKLKDYDGESKHEKEIFEGIFGGAKKKVKMSDLKNKFYKRIDEIKKHTTESVLQRKYFAKNPIKVRAAYYGLAGLTFVVGMVTLLFFTFLAHNLLGTSLIICGIVIFFFGRKMPARTEAGSKAYEHVLGFKDYLYTAERFRLKATTAETFETFLPYAMILGVEKQWAARFEDIYKDQDPSWYSSPSGYAFSAYALTNSLSSFNSDFSSTAVSSPGGSASSGSGFSGGGFSGGGGGGGGSSAG